MCGRFTLTTPPESLAAAFGVPEVPAAWRPRYNAAPAQLVAVVGRKPDGKARGMALLRWGFVPRWAESPNKGTRPINAMAETVATKAPFKDSFRDRRCLIPADGFYEWVVEDGLKVPHHFRLRSGEPFAFAGVWDLWAKGGQPPIHSCAVITVKANKLVEPIHDRMPAVLLPGQYDRWLDAETGVEDALSLLKPLPAELMEMARVSATVNKVTNDGPECLESAA